MNRLQSNLINYSNPLIIIGFLFVLGLCAVGAWLFWHESRDDLQQKYSTYSAKRLKKRELQALELEFPSIVEMFALHISSGLSPSHAFVRIAAHSQGQMSTLLNELVASLNQGKALIAALDEMNAHINSSLIRRFNDSIIIAIERGTPLGDVLTRQVDEVRNAQRVQLIEKAGKAEVTLMIPVVFLILPVSVLFALWPSYFALGQSMGA